MSTNERDTHFAGFAKLLWHEVRKTSFDSPGFSEYQQLERYLQLLIAQRAYDLVEHALRTCPLEAFEIMGDGVQYVPDLTKWPEAE